MEGGYNEYLLLHGSSGRDFRKDSKYQIMLGVLLLIVIGCASGLEILQVDVVRDNSGEAPSSSSSGGGSNGDNGTTTTTTTPPKLLSAAASYNDVDSSANSLNVPAAFTADGDNDATTTTTASPSTVHTDLLQVFVFYRCLQRHNATTGAEESHRCELVVFHDSCLLEKVMMFCIAICVAVAALFVLISIFAAIHSIQANHRHTKTQWITSVVVLAAAVGAASCVLVMVAGDSALCSAGTHKAAASLDAFRFEPAFWLIIAVPVISVVSLGLSFQSC